MKLVNGFTVLLCAIALTLSACGDSKDGNTAGGPQGKRIDVSRYPIVENSPYGAWLAQDTIQNGVHITALIYFNANEMGISATCSLGNDSITAAAVGTATVPMANQGVIAIPQTVEDLETGKLAGQNFSCNAYIAASNVQYTISGEVMTATVSGHLTTLTRVR